MEEMIESDPRVRGALMFGRGKPFNGVLIEPSAGNEVSIDDPDAVNAYLDLIWYLTLILNPFSSLYIADGLYSQAVRRSRQQNRPYAQSSRA